MIMENKIKYEKNEQMSTYIIDGAGDGELVK